MSGSPDKMNTGRGANGGNGIASNGAVPAVSSSSAQQFDSLSRASGSDFSLSLGTGETEVSAEKYSKLVSEYSKIRSQFGVLRKAFLEEKSKSQAAEEQLKQRDQDVRKLEQETESLTFRNTQLSKRVGVLQSDLDDSGTKSRGFFSFASGGESTASGSASKHRSQSNASSTSGPASAGVVNENDLFEELNQKLKNTMVENEQLKANMASLESKLSEADAIFTRKIKDAQSGADESIAELNNQIKKLSKSLVNAKQEKSDAENNLKNFKTKFELSENASRAQIQELGEQLRKKVCDSISPAHSSHSLNEQSLPRSGSFSGDGRNRLTPGLAPRSGSLSIRKRPGTINRSSSSATGNGSLEKGNVCLPSHSSASYQNEELRNQVIDQFTSKICELICALSTVHSHFATKVSVLFAMFNNEDYHFYFDAKNSANSLQNKNFLRQLSQTIQSGYDTPLIHLEESLKMFVDAWKKCFKTTDEAELAQLASDITKYTAEIVKEFGDYTDYLKKAEPLAISCLNSWSKTLKSFNSASNDNDIPKDIFDRLSNNEKRFDLIQKHENLALNIKEFVRIFGQIYGSVKLLLTRSMGSDRFLQAFNQCMQRITSLERCHGELKQNLATKYALEHELNITSRQNLLETDDCLLSALVFLKTIITDIRVLMEVHYFFFICPVSPSSGVSTATISSKTQSGVGISKNRIASPSSPMQNRYIAEEEEEGEGEEEESNSKLLTTQQLKQQQQEIATLQQDKETYTLELEHKALLLEREAKRISELELKVQELLIHLSEKPSTSGLNSKPKLNDQLSITSSASISASPMTDCFGVQYPIHNSNDDLPTPDIPGLIKELTISKEPKKDQYWKEQLSQILDFSQVSSAKLATSQLESSSVRQLYAQLDASKVELEGMLQSNASELEAAKEEFRTSIENYQAQLQALTEHLAIQNDTIAAQREQIDTLRYEASNPNNDKNPPNGSSKAPAASTSFVSKAFSGFKKG